MSKKKDLQDLKKRLNMAVKAIDLKLELAEKAGGRVKTMAGEDACPACRASCFWCQTTSTY